LCICHDFSFIFQQATTFVAGQELRIGFIILGISVIRKQVIIIPQKLELY